MTLSAHKFVPSSFFQDCYSDVSVKVMSRSGEMFV